MKNNQGKEEKMYKTYYNEKQWMDNDHNGRKDRGKSCKP